MKIGALIRAAVRMDALCGGARADQLAHLDQFAASLGLAFQVRDDILDVKASAPPPERTPVKQRPRSRQ